MNVKMAENGSCSTDPDASRKPLYTFSDRTNRRLSQPSAVDEPAFSRADLSLYPSSSSRASSGLAWAAAISPSSAGEYAEEAACSRRSG